MRKLYVALVLMLIFVGSANAQWATVSNFQAVVDHHASGPTDDVYLKVDVEYDADDSGYNGYKLEFLVDVYGTFTTYVSTDNYQVASAIRGRIFVDSGDHSTNYTCYVFVYPCVINTSGEITSTGGLEASASLTLTHMSPGTYTNSNNTVFINGCGGIHFTSPDVHDKLTIGAVQVTTAWGDVDKYKVEIYADYYGAKYHMGNFFFGPGVYNTTLYSGGEGKWEAHGSDHRSHSYGMPAQYWWRAEMYKWDFEEEEWQEEVYYWDSEPSTLMN